MLWLNGIGKSFGPQALFESVDWQINRGQRVGLIGPNGAGKSTLIKIIVGLLESDHGRVTSQRGLRLGYLPQDIAELGSNSVRSEASKGLSALLHLRDQVSEIAHKLEKLGKESQRELEDDHYQDLLEQYGALQSRFEQQGGFEMDAKVEQVLCGLGFRSTQLDDPCDTLSGGWQMRVVLARLLLESPDCLLLDEPTNHLDLESVGWLKHFLQNFEGSLILISHDRWFLNEICTHIAELTQAGVTLYTGHFEDYLKQVEQRRELLDRQRKNQEKRAAQLELFIERFRYKATKAKQVQSRVKQLEKMQAVGEVNDITTINFKLADPPKCGRTVITLEEVEQGYHEGQVLYRGLDLKVERGQHIALVGPNGAGKSTLLKLFAGEVHPRRGVRELGHLVKPYYFAQHQAEALTVKYTVLQETQSAQEDASITHLRSILGAFLFDNDDVKKKVGVLSGGEKNRLALVKMLLTPSNLLLLDEPTNHLDMGSRAVLAQALRAYEGAVVLISHDRYFIDEVCDEVWEVNEGRVTPFLGSYSYYLDQTNRGLRPAPFPLSAPPPPSGAAFGLASGAEPSQPQPKINRKAERRRIAELRQERAKVLKPLKKRVETAERDIERLEELLAELEDVQCAPDHYQDAAEVVRVNREVKQAQRDLEVAMATWEEAEEALGEAASKFDES
jgi:ATP-binding cassette subfamily F protein 3